ncbi:hypothetical protein TWF225_012091 [Orbilia oligospora]|uniref:Uncharacterized protein n=1 Tax=Orbilia oligospora TaxID=2813651 RepID=A0A7C8K4W0_ORBOL|nr:hypothetical protein TWF751_012137 [Orbilia oligospora]KAF3186014.1 hypothetical protein TWF225_012091 [Orbilia oligospora]KAF3241888.1 hypothetical protein TWF217_012095 [Orbilia oligospora]KAF3262638.1 hypothetical protein TWF128_012077 [Orbilia oligospora]KAF3295875.1 hypothetical protein TWF132_012084 [Orbilia oligospora]
MYVAAKLAVPTSLSHCALVRHWHSKPDESDVRFESEKARKRGRLQGVRPRARLSECFGPSSGDPGELAAGNPFCQKDLAGAEENGLRLQHRDEPGNTWCIRWPFAGKGHS